ncbi:hypothetical protein SAMN02910317_01133 [Ruminococcaceae bacterium FB2012]|nr:hypothetical protein SAMN02910317_01133 [Ruminococcaceae bacterium FB2012]
MKKTKRTAMIAAAFAAAVSLTACSGGSSSGKADDVTPGVTVSNNSFDASSEEPQEVYGPPTDFDASSEEVQDVYGPPVDYDPSSDNVQTDYGALPVYPDSEVDEKFDSEAEEDPGSVVDKDPASAEDRNANTGDDSFQPKANMEPTVYGPPSFFDSSEQ